MSNTTDLVSLPGTIAEFTFSPTGSVVECSLKDSERLDADVLDLLGHVCVANLAVANMQARGWEQISEIKGFYPVEGFSFIGANLSVVTRGQRAVVLDNRDADYDAAYRALEK
jgi:roadblock/LC7 domain-containing protein